MTLRPLLAYLPWQARDHAVRALAPLAIMVAIAGMTIFAYLRSNGLDSLVDNSEQVLFVQAVYAGVANLAVTLGAFLFMTASVALDREKQYVRFYFSHQVNPVAFYLQRFVVGLVVYVAVFSIAPLVVELALVDVHVWGSLAAFALNLVLVGGLAVLCGALTNRDGLALILSFIVIRTLQQILLQGLLPEWAEHVVRGLPPIETMTVVAKALIEGASVKLSEVIHVVGYGVGLLASGLFVMRRGALVR